MQNDDSYEELQQIFKDMGITEEDLFGDNLDEFTKKLIKNISKRARDHEFGDGFSVSYGVDNPGPGVGFIKFSADDVVSISNTKAFASICHVANFVEAYVEDGKIVIEMTFSNTQLDN